MKNQMNRENGFFKETRNALDNITDLYTSFWGMAAGIWYLGHNVRNFIKTDEGSRFNDVALANYFIAESGIHGVNIRSAYIDASWQEYQERLAWILLVNLIAIYDDWYSAIQHRGGKFNKPNGESDYHFRIDGNNLKVSKDLRDTLYPAYCDKSMYDKLHIDHLMYCYNCFRNIRNVYSHKGKIADKNAIKAYSAYRGKHDSKEQLHVKESPKLNEIYKDKIIHLDLRGVVGFSQILRKIIYTIDVEFIPTSVGERYFISECEKIGKIQMKRNNSKNDDNIKCNMTSYLRKASFISPKNTNQLLDLLKENGLVTV